MKTNLTKILIITIFLIACLANKPTHKITGELESKKIILAKAQKLFNAFPKNKIYLPFTNKKRTQWEYLPTGTVARTGVSLAQMNEQQTILTHQFLATLLSSQGYLKINGIMHLDGFLKKYFDEPAMKRSQQEYNLTFFGTPNENTAWTLRFEGHHLSLNFTYTAKQLSLTPLFLGTNPSTIYGTEYSGWRVLAKEEDKAFRFLASLDKNQKKKALLSRRRPSDIINTPNAKLRLQKYWGIPATQLTPHQQNLLINLIDEYISNYRKEISSEQMTQIKKQLPQTYFAWIGHQDKLKPYYYIIHSPSIIIEFHSRGTKAKHTHSVWHNKQNNFANDTLKNHLKIHN